MVASKQASEEGGVESQVACLFIKSVRVRKKFFKTQVCFFLSVLFT